jgi:hypothetical protein
MANDGVNGGGQASSTGAASPEVGNLREYQELWFSLRKRDWMSVVLVPADPGGSAANIGKALADIGSRLSEIPVTAISASSMGYDSAFALADLQQHVVRDWRSHVEPTPAIDVTGRVISHHSPAAKPEDEPPVRSGGKTETLAAAPTARLINAIPPVISEPLGLAAAHSADAIVIVVEVGRTRLADARRTVELIGRERIAGCFIVR